MIWAILNWMMFIIAVICIFKKHSYAFYYFSALYTLLLSVIVTFTCTNLGIISVWWMWLVVIGSVAMGFITAKGAKESFGWK